MGKRARGRRSRDAWAETVARFERSGLTQVAFCRRERVTLGTFRAWLYRLRAEGAGAAGPGFLEVEAVAPQEAGCVVRVAGAEIGFSAAPEPSYLAALVSALERDRR
jgi:hypothetical protein